MWDSNTNNPCRYSNPASLPHMFMKHGKPSYGNLYVKEGIHEWIASESDTEPCRQVEQVRRESARSAAEPVY